MTIIRLFSVLLFLFVPPWSFSGDKPTTPEAVRLREWTFREPDDFQGWEARHWSKVSVAEYSLRGRTEKNAQLSSPPIDLPADKCNILSVRIKSDSVGSCRIFFRTDEEKQFSPAKMTVLKIKGDNRFGDYQVNLGLHSLWTGMIRQLRFDPVNEANIEIAWLNLDYSTAITRVEKEAPSTEAISEDKSVKLPPALQLPSPADLSRLTRTSVLEISAEPVLDKYPVERQIDILRGSREKFQPVCDFQDLSGWKLELYGSARAQAARSREVPLWDSYCLKIQLLAGVQQNGYLCLIPPRPLLISNTFTSVQLYGRLRINSSNKTEIANNRGGYVKARFRDRSGSIYTVPLGPLTHTHQGQWRLLHCSWQEKSFLGPAAGVDQVTLARIGGLRRCSWEEEGQGSPQLPLQLTALIILLPREEVASQVEAIYLDSLGLSVDLQPQLPPGTDLDLRPYLQTTDTILPMNKERKYTNLVMNVGKSYLFKYSGPDGELVYSYKPQSGLLSDIQVSWNGKTTFSPLHGGGLNICPGDDDREVIAAVDPLATRELLSVHQVGERVLSRWRQPTAGTPQEYTVEMQVKQKSLIIDLHEDSGRCASFTFGRAEGVAAGRLVDIPYMQYDGSSIFNVAQPLALLVDNQLFVTAILDWYSSDCTYPFGANPDQTGRTADTFIYNGGCYYLRKTDGRRNPLRERIFLTVSPDYQEVLPSIPNPRSTFISRMAGSWYVFRADVMPEFFRRLHEFGLRDILALHHINHSLNPGDGNAVNFRVDHPRAALLQGRWLEDYVDGLRRLGYSYGFLTYGDHISPFNQYFQEGLISRGQDNSFRFVIGDTLALKPAQGLQLFRDYYPKMYEKYRPDFHHFDTYAAVSEIEHIDFDSRNPQAASYRQSLAYKCLQLLEVKKYGVIANVEGRRHFMVAGFADSAHGTCDGRQFQAERLLIPDFNLLKIHPLMVTYYTKLFHNRRAKNLEVEPATGFSQERAWVIANGHAGWTYPPISSRQDRASFARILSDYYTFKSLQGCYLPARAVAIEFYDAGRFYDTSTALKNGAIDGGRLRVRYENGTEVWVNYNKSDDWTVPTTAGDLVLPPWGYYCYRRNYHLQYAARRGEDKIEYVQSPGYLFIDTFGRMQTCGPLSARGAAAVLLLTNNALLVIPTGGYGNPVTTTELSPTVVNGRRIEDLSGFEKVAAARGCPIIELDKKYFFPGRTVLAVEAYTDDGQPGGPYPFQDTGEKIRIEPNDKFLKYLVRGVK